MFFLTFLSFSEVSVSYVIKTSLCDFPEGFTEGRGKKNTQRDKNDLGLDGFNVTCAETGLLESGSNILLYTYLSTTQNLKKDL